jgi:CPA2 family monovalent cation:H+ antiporter-2
MHHDTPLISTIVAGLVLAYIFGMIANRLRLPPLVGYLFAGIVVGPYTPGFVADQALGSQLAELGVILLMFGVGLHFSLKDLMSVRALAIPGAVVQIGFATLLGSGLGLLLGWNLGGALLFGLALSVASTVVLLKALQERRLIESERGRIAVGWLIVEDLAMVLALVLVPAIAGLYGIDTGVHDPFVSFVERLIGSSIGIWGVLAITLVKVAAFVGFMLVVGRRLIPWTLHATAHTGSRELFRLAVLAIALGVALGSASLFGVSLALGAFFAGMILSESELSQRAASETLPLRDAFSVLFFVSVGMLFDPYILLEQPFAVLATVFIIVIGKSLAAFGIVLAFRRPVGTALTISASLAQIGEFSFILASMGVALAILPPEGRDLILAGALISIVLNPLVFWASERLRPALDTRFGNIEKVEPLITEPVEPSMAGRGPAASDMPGEGAVDRGAQGADDDNGEASRQKDHIVMVGFGQVGRIVAAGIRQDGGALVVIEDSDADVAAARAAGHEVIFGNAARQDVLKLANLAEARCLLVAISNGFEAGSVCESAHRLNPDITIIARAHSEEEESFLNGLGASVIIRGEEEIGRGILAFIRAEAPPKLPEVGNILAQEALAVNVPLAAAAPPAQTVPEIAAIEAPLDQAEPEALEVTAVAEQNAPQETWTDETPVIGEAPAEIDEIAPQPIATDTEAKDNSPSGSVLNEPEPLADDIPKVLQAPAAELDPVAVADDDALPEHKVEPEGSESPDDEAKGGVGGNEPVEVVAPPVEPEPRGRGGKRKK